jgi:drug/metabolite transporter (DMT)-like permease
VVGAGVLASALGPLRFFTLVARAGATNALLVTILMPLTPILLGAMLLGERLTIREAAGAAVIALALLAVDARLLGRRGR